jgi:hypothetical protein
MGHVRGAYLRLAPMSEERSTYIRLLDLAVDWAAAAGMPKELVLRRLCEWAMAGAFPERAFITATGPQVSPFDIYLSFRAVTENDGLFGSGGIYLDGCTIYNNNERWGMHVLAKVLVTAPSVLAFCERTETLAPPSLLSGFSRFLARWNQTKHLAPSECPDANEHAARHQARDFAVGWINSLRTTLSDLRGEPTRFGPRTVPDEPIDFKYLGTKWKKTHDDAQNAIARSHDAGLQQELDSVDAEWVAFVGQMTATIGATETICQSQENSVVLPVHKSERPKRRGRPSGSGSYEASDALIVEQMRKTLIMEPNLSPTAAAIRFADSAVGGGTPDKAKRLVERYSVKYGDRPR